MFLSDIKKNITVAILSLSQNNCTKWCWFYAKFNIHTVTVGELSTNVVLALDYLEYRVTEIWVNIGSGNGLLPDGTKPLPEPVLAYHQ